MLNVLTNVACGDGAKIIIDETLPNVISMLVTIIKIAIPVALIIFGMIDLGKAVMSNDEKEMKGAQTKFIKRCLYAVIVFFVVAIVQFVVSVLDSSGVEEGEGAKSCINCFINGSCDPVKGANAE